LPTTSATASQGTADRGDRLVVLSFVAEPETLCEYERSGSWSSSTWIAPFTPSPPSDGSRRPPTGLSTLSCRPHNRWHARGYTEFEAGTLLSGAWIPTFPLRLAVDADSAATELGFPVAVKIVSPHNEHKRDMGGVALGLLAGVTAAWLRLSGRPHAVRGRTGVEERGQRDVGVLVGQRSSEVVAIFRDGHVDPFDVVVV
jgi:hypothetical protein